MYMLYNALTRYRATAKVQWHGCANISFSWCFARDVRVALLFPGLVLLRLVEESMVWLPPRSVPQHPVLSVGMALLLPELTPHNSALGVGVALFPPERHSPQCTGWQRRSVQCETHRQVMWENLRVLLPCSLNQLTVYPSLCLQLWLFCTNLLITIRKANHSY